MTHPLIFKDDITGHQVSIWHAEIATLEEIPTYDQYRDKILSRRILITTNQGKQYKSGELDFRRLTEAVTAAREERQ